MIVVQKVCIDAVASASSSKLERDKEGVDVFGFSSVQHSSSRLSRSTVCRHGFVVVLVFVRLSVSTRLERSFWCVTIVATTTLYPISRGFLSKRTNRKAIGGKRNEGNSTLVSFDFSLLFERLRIGLLGSYGVSFRISLNLQSNIPGVPKHASHRGLNLLFNLVHRFYIHPRALQQDAQVLDPPTFALLWDAPFH